MRRLATLLFCLLSLSLFSQDSVNHVFTLGQVVVTPGVGRQINSSVNARQLQEFARNDVSKALNLLPGVNLSAVGPRNEAMVYVRGFDLRQTPLLIDGIPVYIPYDGYVDLARFTTFDLAEVNVSKGYTSVIYGPNALGGAINLVSRRPVKKFELNGAAGWLSGGYRGNINVGSNLGKFYLQAGASKVNRDSFPLPGNYKPVKTEDGGWRNNSYSTDEKYSIKVGYIPGKKSEYALSYIYQHGKKGTPVYAGSDTLNSLYKSPRYWQWPYWDKRSLYFISNTTFGDAEYLKTRFYYDKFKNQLNSYDDVHYTTISKPYAFKSIYDDYTVGGIVEYGKGLWQSKDVVKTTVQWKQDVHREHNEGEPVRTMSDNTYTVGIENELKLPHRFVLLTGLSFNRRASIKAQDYNSATRQVSNFPGNDNNAFNIQGGLEYHPDDNNLISLSVARKTRFATTKDRYSYRLGTAIPNPDLHAEYAVNYDLGYKGRIGAQWMVEASLFYSNIGNTILSVSNVRYDSVRHVWQSQLQNTGRSEYLGGEVGVEYRIAEAWKTGVNYTYIKRNNLSNPALHFTDVPGHKFFGYLQYQLRDRLSVQANTEYDSQRYSTTYGAAAGSFMLLNTRAALKVLSFLSLEAGINNITDRNYSLVEGYPEPGRNYFVNLVYQL
ncbi:MAG: TonB-dependent receptor [Chitinophagaceae bacterium]|nr:TonB-dependent receptor [Chitinophagaceae bacterium]